MQPRIIIRTHRPALRAALAVVLTMLLVLAAWGLYSLARSGTSPDFAKAETERSALIRQQRELSQQLRLAKAEISKLRTELAYAKQSETIGGEASKALRSSLNAVENESAKLREQLSFYKGIANPQEARAGVRVQDVKMRTVGDHLRYELVLIQSVREENRIAGTVEMSIVGVNTLPKGSTPQTLALKQLVTTGDKDLVFSFKYYEEFAGEFKLPEGFTPSKLIVTMKAVNDRPVATEEFPWNTIASTQDLNRD